MPLTWEYLGTTSLKKMSVAQKHLYSGLPLLMAATGVGYLCPESAESL